MTRLLYNEKALVEVTKEFTFDSCHHLLDYVGKCANPHGHTYKLQVTLKGTLDNIGMVLDFSILKKVVKERIIEKLDHKDLNKELHFNTTAENMCVWIFDKLNNDERIIKSKAKVVKVRLWETPTSFAEYKGEVM